VPAVANLTAPAVAGDDTAQRERIAELLDGGLRTESAGRAYDDRQIAARLARLRSLAPVDLAGKLVAAGFTLEGFRDPADHDLSQACSTCMYYETHRRFCALPELMLPVEPAWSCVLWRI